MTQEESALVGCLIIDANGCEVCNELGIVPESFTDNRLGTIYSTICALYETLPYVDLTIINAALTEQKSLAKIGGYEFLEKVADSSGSVTHTRHYAEMVANKWNKRNLLSTMDALRETIADLSFEAGRAEAEAVVMSLQTKGAVEQDWATTVSGAVDMADAIRSGLIEPGIMTGLHELDSILNGLKNGKSYVLAARPSMGKSSLALNIAERASIDKHVLLFTAEMTAEEYATRILCAKTGIYADRIDKRLTTEEDIGTLRDASRDVSTLHLHIVDVSGKDIADVRSKARQINRKHKLGLVIIDYIQLLSCRAQARNGRQVEVGGISQGCKAMAMELNVPVLPLSQLSRKVEDRANKLPMCSDLRDSGTIEQDADAVIFVHRPCRYPDDPMSHDLKLAIISVAKHRGGRIGNAEVDFIAEKTTFQDRIEEKNWLEK